MRTRRHRQRGFTLIELLIVVGIIGIIAAILIPNLLDALQKAKQKRTVADMRNTGTAWMSWVSDVVSAGAAGAQSSTWDSSAYAQMSRDDLYSTLHPSSTLFYTNEVPLLDGWKRTFLYAYTGDPLSSQIIAIVSLGKDGGVTNASPVVMGPFVPTQYNQDIIWADGFFIRWPGGADTGS